MVQQLVIPAEPPLQAGSIQVAQSVQIPKIHLKLQKRPTRNNLIPPQTPTATGRQQGHHRATLIHKIAHCEPQRKDDLRLQEGKGQSLDPHQQTNPITAALIPRSAPHPVKVQSQPTPDGLRHLQEVIHTQKRRSQLHRSLLARDPVYYRPSATKESRI